MSTSLPQAGAARIRAAFEEYQARFREITRRGRVRFENRDWHGLQQDSARRLDVREQVIRRTLTELAGLFGSQLHDKTLWARMKWAYVELANCHANPELAETFFSSVTRRIFATLGVDPNVEFVDTEFDCAGAEPEQPIYETFAGDDLEGIVRQILTHYTFRAAYQNIQLDARLVAAEIDRRRQAEWKGAPIERIEIARPVFYRNKGAYLVGRICSGHRTMPIVLALLHAADGVYVDAVLLAEDEASILFSFTRSYFLVDVERPRELVLFLKSILPAKRIAELYISIGYNKHGKTELYRELIHYLDATTGQFERAPGERGMVMAVFTLNSYDLVFKVIRDRFDYPKTTTRREVMDKYNLVFKHDRAGRLVDAQGFEHLAFPRNRFSEPLLRELMSTARDSLILHDDAIVIKHLYIERRVTPLNLYLAGREPEAAREAVLDYGRAIRDMAATNIFPGDLLLKNFGVTRHGRVIFYDYDELCLLADCNFRELPQPQYLDEELRAEPWFYVGPMDIFPEEFMTFIGLQGELRDAFLQAHGDLLRPGFWKAMQARHLKGEIIDLFPYPKNRSLRVNLPS